MDSPKFNRRPFWHRILPAICAIIVSMAAITNQSLWMDEGGTMFRSMIPGLDDWWKMMLHLKGSEVLMPVYMFYAWFWHQVLGATGEYALRLSNLPWLVLAVVVLARVRFWPLVCLLSPFVLYFMDEFRPYMMHIAAGACAASALGRWMDASGKDALRGVHPVCAACLFLTACSMTGVVWAAGVAAGAVLIRPECLRRAGFWLRCLPWLAAATAVAAYYGIMMAKGYRAAGIQDAGILNVLFGVYEMTGLLGLGPGKNELRQSVSAVLPHLWLLVPGAVCIGGAWLCGLVSWARTAPVRYLAGVAAAVLMPLLMLAIAGILMDFRVVGRHLSPAIPAILLPIAACLRTASPRRGTALALGSSACLFMAISALNIRLLERHRKDDYRTATTMAISALKEGKRIWWRADMNAPRYYAYLTGGFPMVNRIQEIETDPPTSPMFADVIFISRPEVYFPGIDHKAYLGQHFFKLDRTFPGFEVWVADGLK